MRLARGPDLVAVSAAAALTAAALCATELTTGPDLRLLDLVQGWLPPASGAAPPVVLVAIDEASLQAFGRWPWPRRRFAELLDALAEGSPAAVAFDILFAEPDPDPGSDAALAASMGRLGRTVLAVAGTYHGPTTPALEVLPAAALAEAAAALGHTNLAADGDGRVRRLHLRAGLGTAYWMALGQVTLLVAEGRPRPEPPAAFLTDRPLAWVAEETRLVPFAAASRLVRRVSFAELVGPSPPELPRGAVIVVGVTAGGLAPRFDIADGGGRTRTVAGVELHAAAMAALAAGGPLRPISTGSASVAGAAAAVVAAVLVLAAPGRWARRRLVTAALAGIAATITACALLAVLAGLWWSPLPVLAGLGAAFVTELVRRWLKQRLAPHPPQAGAGLVPVSTGDGAPTTDPAPHLPSVGAATRAITRRSPD